MSRSHKKNRGVSRAGFAFVLSLIFVFASAGYAFGDFVPVGSTKVLGVGRIQNTSHLVPVASENKFVVSDNAAPTEETLELAVPISREVAVADIPEPEPVPASKPDTTPTQNNNTGVSAEAASGWTSTMATNYATSGDGFLNKRTASGSYTSTTSMGVAHKSLPLGTQIEIYCPQSGLSCIAVVNDRGPYGGYWGGQPDTFDFQMGVTSALGGNYGWYAVQYRIL